MAAAARIGKIKIVKYQAVRLFGNAEADVLAVRMFALTKALRRAPTTQDVLDDARDAESPFHKYMEWDDTKAADGFRLIQAKRIINSIQVVIETESGSQHTIRAFPTAVDPMLEEERPVRRYHGVQTLIARPELFQQALDEFHRLLDRAAELCAIWEELAKSVGHHVKAAAAKLRKRPNARARRPTAKPAATRAGMRK